MDGQSQVEQKYKRRDCGSEFSHQAAIVEEIKTALDNQAAEKQRKNDKKNALEAITDEVMVCEKILTATYHNLTKSVQKNKDSKQHPFF